MAKDLNPKLQLDELCELVNMSPESIIELVENGIVEPIGRRPNEWVFDVYVVKTVKKAYRLQRDFDIDLAGTALVLDLLEKLEKLQVDNNLLRQRLKRFLQD